MSEAIDREPATPVKSRTTAVLRSLWSPAGLLLALAAAVLVTKFLIALGRALTPSEQALFDALTASLGLIGAAGVGRNSAREITSETIRREAHMAVRHLEATHASLRRTNDALNRRSITPEQLQMDVTEWLNDVRVAILDWHEAASIDVAPLGDPPPEIDPLTRYIAERLTSSPRSEPAPLISSKDDPPENRDTWPRQGEGDIANKQRYESTFVRHSHSKEKPTP